MLNCDTFHMSEHYRIVI